MKFLTALIGTCLSFILMLPLLGAQGKDGVKSAGEHSAPDFRPSPHSAPDFGPSPHSAAGTGAGGTVTTGSATPSVGSTSNSGTAGGQPDLRGSSFQNSNSYYTWNNYYSYLATSFDVSPIYFDRFYRNTEPLITPVMLKLTLREPIKLSSEMLDSIDRLQEMFEAGLSGASTDRQALVEKSRQIRELAKRIRRNQTLACVDLRKNKNLYDSAKHNAFGPEEVQELRGMATNLDRQLRNMYHQSSTSTISVESYKEPSLESLTKGIEKICKEMETHSKRL